MLGLVSQERLDEMSRDQGFLAQLERVKEDFDRYLSQPRIQAMDYCPEEAFKVEVVLSISGFKLETLLDLYHSMILGCHTIRSGFFLSKVRRICSRKFIQTTFNLLLYQSQERNSNIV